MFCSQSLKTARTIRGQVSLSDSAIRFTKLMLSVLILACEDNCMGVDMDDDASAYDQPLLASTQTSSEAFHRCMTSLVLDTGRSELIKNNPLELISIYSATMVTTFAAHLDLCQRHWDITYEPYAYTSVVYGYAYHRDAVRQLVRRYATHLRYINQTIESLNVSGDNEALKPLLLDFENFAQRVSCLRSLCLQFLEQQVGKLALQDTRTQMREARDLQRISYLAFIFVPLSLASSFFGMNVQELGSGPTPVWIFVVTALGVLLGSFLTMWISGLTLWTKLWTEISACPGRLKSLLLPHRNPAAHAPSPPLPPMPIAERPTSQMIRGYNSPAPQAVYEPKQYETSAPPANPYYQPVYELSAAGSPKPEPLRNAVGASQERNRPGRISRTASMTVGLESSPCDSLDAEPSQQRSVLILQPSPPQLYPDTAPRSLLRSSLNS